MYFHTLITAACRSISPTSVTSAALVRVQSCFTFSLGTFAIPVHL